MAITYSFDPEKGLVRTTVIGNLTLDDTLDYFKRLSSDPECPGPSIEIVDFTGVTDFTLQYTQMRYIAERFQSTKSSREILATIFHCRSQVEYGIARMLQMFHEFVNSEHIVHISRSEEELEQLIERVRGYGDGS